MLFDEYLFADYSGAFDPRTQRRAIRLAIGTTQGLTRDDLVKEFVSRLRDAHRRGVRVRIGDNGSVGGQSLVGMLAIRNLLGACVRENIKVAVWPFDGLSLIGPAYDGAHVMVEPYPSAVRSSGIAQTDESDALACAAHMRTADLNGQLHALLDLSSIGSADAALVAVEGWIVAHQANRLKQKTGR